MRYLYEVFLLAYEVGKNSRGLEKLLMLDENIEKMFNLIEEILLN